MLGGRRIFVACQPAIELERDARLPEPWLAQQHYELRFALLGEVPFRDQPIKLGFPLHEHVVPVHMMSLPISNGIFVMDQEFFADHSDS